MFCNFLTAYLKARGYLPHEDTLFVSRTDEPLTSGVLQMINSLGDKAGIRDRQVSPHVLRHCAATFWIKNGGDSMTLRSQLGHSDSRTVDAYINLVGRDIAGAHRKYSSASRIFRRG